MNDYERYDKILRELPKGGKDIDPGDHSPVDLRYLESKEFVKLKLVPGGGVFMMSLTPNGMAFISEGGFTQLRKNSQIQKERAEIEFNWKKRDEKRKNISIGFGIVMAMLAFWNASIQYMNWETKENTKIQIDSIKASVYSSQLRIDSLSKIVNDRSTKNAIDGVNKIENISESSNTQ